jgi:hypothetical protein
LLLVSTNLTLATAAVDVIDPSLLSTNLTLAAAGVADAACDTMILLLLSISLSLATFVVVCRGDQ